MPPRSKVAALPVSVKKWLDDALLENNFANYELLATELKDKGYAISKTGLHRYGQKFEERLQTLKIVTEQAQAIVQANPDDDDALNQALIRLTQEKLFTVLMELEVDPTKIDIAKLTKSIAEIARSSTGAKEYASKVRQRVKEAAKEVGETVKGAGLTDEVVEQIKRSILGIAE